MHRPVAPLLGGPSPSSEDMEDCNSQRGQEISPGVLRAGFMAGGDGRAGVLRGKELEDQFSGAEFAFNAGEGGSKHGRKALA